MWRNLGRQGISKKTPSGKLHLFSGIVAAVFCFSTKRRTARWSTTTDSIRLPTTGGRYKPTTRGITHLKVLGSPFSPRPLREGGVGTSQIWKENNYWHWLVKGSSRDIGRREQGLRLWECLCWTPDNSSEKDINLDSTGTLCGSCVVYKRFSRSSAPPTPDLLSEGAIRTT